MKGMKDDKYEKHKTSVGAISFKRLLFMLSLVTSHTVPCLLYRCLNFINNCCSHLTISVLEVVGILPHGTKKYIAGDAKINLGSFT